jgi:DNA-directed RNA polymerase delta subunit
MQSILAQAGRPLPVGQVAQELALMRGRSRQELLRVVSRLVGSRDTYFVLPDGRVGLRAWLLDVFEGDDEAAVRRHNFFHAKVDLDGLVEEFDLPQAAKAGAPLDSLLDIVTQAAEPIGTRVAMYLVWRARGEALDSEAVFDSALDDDRFALVAGPALATPDYIGRLAAVIEGLSAEHDAEGVAAEAVADIQDILEAEAPVVSDDFTVGADDAVEVQRIIQEAGAALPLGNIVSDVFELFPGDLKYVAAVRSVRELLQADDRFVELPDNRWHLRVLLPPTLYRVPVTLQLSPVLVTTLTGEEVDSPMVDSGLEGGLEWEVRAPDLEDIGEEDEVPTVGEHIQLATRQRFVTSYRHFVSGTVKVRKIDRGVFPLEPPIRPIKLIDKSDGEDFELWLNNETGLLCGLDGWYKGRLQPAGQVFCLERDEASDLWYGEIQDELDAMLLIPQTRLDELLVLRVRAEHAQDVSVLDIMRQLMESHAAGVSFRRLYAECNIVRRVSKRVIASNLSAYPMFSLGDDETLWLYDERKAGRPRLPAKKQFVLAAVEDAASE